jgi:hypothetical protein
MAEFTDYALWKMGQRGIERDDVELVLAHAEHDFPSRESRRHVYARHIGARLLLVLVEPYDHNLVVNAYWPIPKGTRR